MPCCLEGRCDGEDVAARRRRRASTLRPVNSASAGSGGDHRLRARVVAAVRPRGRRFGAGVAGRQVEREGAALVGRAHDLDRAAEQTRDLAADGEPEPGAAVLAAGRAVGLLEGLEDELLLLERDADARVLHREARAMPSPVSARRRLDGERRRLPLAVNLKRVRQQVLQDLLQPVDVA